MIHDARGQLRLECHRLVKRWLQSAFCMGDITAVDYPINVAGNSHGRCITYGYLLGKDLAK